MSHLKPRTATVLIYHGDDLEKLAALRRDVEVTERIADQALADAEARAKGESLRAGDDDPVVAARRAWDAAVKPKRAAYDTFVAEAAERALEVSIQAIGRRRFARLVCDHPPRMVTEVKPPAEEGSETEKVEVVHADDRMWGVNIETLPTALLTFIDPADTEVRTVTAPVFKGGDECEAFLDDELSEGDFDRLWVAAFMLNRTPSADPKESLYSTASPTSDET